MNPTIVGIVVFACTFGGSLLGMWLRTALPGHHLESESKDTIKLGIGLIATMTALVLGIVTGSSKSSFDAEDTTVKQTAIQILTLDRLLGRYGPDTSEIRKGLKQVVGDRIDMIWPQDSSKPASLDPISSGSAPMGERLGDAIRALKPSNDAQRALQSRALDITEALLQTRWMVLAGTENTVPFPFLVVLLFWLAIAFASYGLFAPWNATVIAVLCVCALSIAGAIFLVLEMDAPFTGLIRVSPVPLRYAYAHLNQ